MCFVEKLTVKAYTPPFLIHMLVLVNILPAGIKVPLPESPIISWAFTRSKTLKLFAIIATLEIKKIPNTGII